MRAPPLLPPRSGRRIHAVDDTCTCVQAPTIEYRLELAAAGSRGRQLRPRPTPIRASLSGLITI